MVPWKRLRNFSFVTSVCSIKLVLPEKKPETLFFVLVFVFSFFVLVVLDSVLLTKVLNLHKVTGPTVKLPRTGVSFIMNVV